MPTSFASTAALGESGTRTRSNRRLARPRQKWAYGDQPDLPTLAAAYGFGLVRNHPYRDGNKRIGFLAMVTFLGINDQDLGVTDTEVVTEIVALAAGHVSEDDLALWIRERLDKQ
jgi:death-on-curing protein